MTQTHWAQTPEAAVVRAAMVYADLRRKVDHVNPRGHTQCTEDRVTLFDQLDQAEKHLLCAVKHLPQCLSDAEQDTDIARYTSLVSGGEQ